jgi:hypothetical protein
MTQPSITEAHVTLLDVWRLLEDMDRNLNERFDRIDRIEGPFDAVSAHLDRFESRTGALLDSLNAKLDELSR